jgi:hypothetical protein
MGNRLICSCDKSEPNQEEMQFCKAAAPVRFTQDEKKYFIDEIQQLMREKNCEEISETAFENQITDLQKIVIHEIINSNNSLDLKDEDSIWCGGLMIPPLHFKNSNYFYHGKWNDKGEKNGLGKMIKEDGSVYYGKFYADKLEGNGLYITKNGDYYLGDWSGDKASGRGALVQTQGKSRYQGEWLHNKKHGSGEELFPDGSVYSGEYTNNQIEGFGTYVWKDMTKYVGYFKNSMLDGEGEMTWADGRKYTGQFRNDKMHGKGIMNWSNGSVYNGEYKNGLKSGFGILIWNKNKTYTGHWIDNKQHGMGVLKINNKQYSGIWRFGEIIKLREIDQNTDNIFLK